MADLEAKTLQERGLTTEVDITKMFFCYFMTKNLEQSQIPERLH